MYVDTKLSLFGMNHFFKSKKKNIYPGSSRFQTFIIDDFIF